METKILAQCVEPLFYNNLKKGQIYAVTITTNIFNSFTLLDNNDKRIKIPPFLFSFMFSAWKKHGIISWEKVDAAFQYKPVITPKDGGRNFKRLRFGNIYELSPSGKAYSHSVVKETDREADKVWYDLLIKELESHDCVLEGNIEDSLDFFIIKYVAD